MRKIRQQIILLVILALICVGVFLMYNLGGSWEFALRFRSIKIGAMAIVAGCVSYSTVAFQTLTNNRILTPSIMGFESVYMLLQTILVFLYGSQTGKVMNHPMNFALSILLMVGFAFLLYLLIYKREVNNMYLLLLIGLVLGILFNGLSSFMQLLIDPNNFFIVQGKMFASFSNINQDLIGYSAGILVLTLGVGYRYTPRLDVLALGKNQAINLGLNYNKNIQLFLVLVAIMVSVSTALVGPVLFLGLLVSNLTYEICKTYRHDIIIIACTLVTIIVLVGGQFLAEQVFELSTPISIIINFVGGIYFLYLLLKKEKI